MISFDTEYGLNWACLYRTIMRHFGSWDAASASPLPPASGYRYLLWTCSLQTEELQQHQRPKRLRRLLFWCALCYGSVAVLVVVKVSRCSDKKVALQQFYLLWSTCSDWKELKIINLNKYLLHNGSHVRCFTVLHKGQRKLWIYPVYLGRVPVWFMREMRRMRAARLKRSSITNTQETLLKCTERGPQNDSRVSQITWKTWPLGFVILAFELIMKFICREHELLLH